MKARLIILIAALLLPLVLVLSSSTTAQNQSSSCVTCHTDEAMLKKTCKPFVVPEGEGEG
jgi:ABC-type Fe3+-citrate transport system substrate-binding protein